MKEVEFIFGEQLTSIKPYIISCKPFDQEKYYNLLTDELGFIPILKEQELKGASLFLHPNGEHLWLMGEASKKREYSPSPLTLSFNPNRSERPYRHELFKLKILSSQPMIRLTHIDKKVEKIEIEIEQKLLIKKLFEKFHLHDEFNFFSYFSLELIKLDYHLKILHGFVKIDLSLFTEIEYIKQEYFEGSFENSLLLSKREWGPGFFTDFQKTLSLLKKTLKVIEKNIEDKQKEKFFQKLITTKKPFLFGSSSLQRNYGLVFDQHIYQENKSIVTVYDLLRFRFFSLDVIVKKLEKIIHLNSSERLSLFKPLNEEVYIFEIYDAEFILAKQADKTYVYFNKDEKIKAVTKLISGHYLDETEDLLKMLGIINL
jgi:hypothetical protein